MSVAVFHPPVVDTVRRRRLLVRRILHSREGSKRLLDAIEEAEDLIGGAAVDRLLDQRERHAATADEQLPLARAAGHAELEAIEERLTARRRARRAERRRLGV